MDIKEYFEIGENVAYFRPAGTVSLDQAGKIVASAIAFAREQGIPKLLVDMTRLTGFAPPCLGDRYFIVRDWAIAARGHVCVAIVADPKMIHPQKFGVATATNYGLVGDVFISESDALAWLQLQRFG